MKKKLYIPYQKQAGLSLVGLLVSVAIAGILLNGLATVFSSNQNTSRLIHDSGSLQESIRAANDLLEVSLRQAGHFGGIASEEVKVHSQLTITGVGGCNSDWITNTGTPIRSYDGADAINSVKGLPIGCIEDKEYQPNTDLLSIQYASSMDMEPYTSLTNDAVYVRTVLGAREETAAQIFKGADKTSTIGTIGSDPVGTYNYKFSSELYYVRTCSRKANGACQDNIPSLVRYQIDGTRFTEHVLAVGVEQFQVEFGLDTDGNLTADRYASTDNIFNWDQVVSIKYSLVMRGSQQDNAIKDSKTYNLVGNVAFTAKQDDQKFRRRAYTKVVQLRNMIRS